MTITVASKDPVGNAGYSHAKESRLPHGPNPYQARGKF
jgi:hypothetical protein